METRGSAATNVQLKMRRRRSRRKPRRRRRVHGKQSSRIEVMAAQMGRQAADEWKRVVEDKQQRQSELGAAFGGDPGGQVGGQDELPCKRRYIACRFDQQARAT